MHVLVYSTYRTLMSQSSASVKSLLSGLLFSFLFFSQAYPQSGTLDPTFGVGGIVETVFDTFNEECQTIVIQSDDKIVAGGYTQDGYTTADFALVRYTSAGDYDPTFGVAGKSKVYIEDRSKGADMVLQSDGKIVMGGYSKWYINLARWESNGTLDTSFGSNGTVFTDVAGYYSEQCRALWQQNNGILWVGGFGQHNGNDKPYLMILRYLADGVLDTSFGTNGVLIGEQGRGFALAQQSDGKILLAGSSDGKGCIMRWNTDGSVDTSFGNNGWVSVSFGGSSEWKGITILPDGNIIACGRVNNNIALIKYASDGALDTAFGTNGWVESALGSNSIAHTILLESDGHLLIAGKSDTDFLVARYTSAGMLDTSFGSNGWTTTSMGDQGTAYALVQQSDGSIVAGGGTYNGSNMDFALAKYTHDVTSSTPSIDVKSPELSLYPNPAKNTLHIQSGQVLQAVKIELIHVLGQTLLSQTLPAGDSWKVDVGNLPQGMYLLQWTASNKRSTYRFIKE